MSFHNGAPPQMPPLEITQIPQAQVGTIPIPEAASPGTVMLVFSLPNGHQYQFVLDRNGQAAVIRLLGGIVTFKTDDMPKPTTP